MDAIPRFLTDLDRWVLWREVKRAGRVTKLPYGVTGAQVSDVTERHNWGSYTFCRDAMARSHGAWDGSGIVLGEIGAGEALVGLDLDSCIHDGAVAEWAEPYLAALPTYAEVSPSGSGLKCFFRVQATELPAIRALFSIAQDMNGRKKTMTNGNGHAHPPAAEIYLSHRYFTVTGAQWPGAPDEIVLLAASQLTPVAALFGPREHTNVRADEIRDATVPDPADLRAKLAAAMHLRPVLAHRWMGITTGLTDASRSGFDMSLGATLKAAGFTFGEMRAALTANPHGAGAEHADDDRYFERIWSRSVVPVPMAPEEPPAWLDNAPVSEPGWWHTIEHNLVDYQSPAETAETPRGDAETSPPHDPNGSVINPPLHWTAPAPLREWLIDQWIPIGYVTGLYGDGGVGKSLLAQQLLTSTALGLPWLGLDVRPGRAFGVMCEDDASELHRRQQGINQSYGVEMANLENLRIAARLGFDNLLMTFDQENRGKLTELYAELCRWLDSFRPRVVVLDTLADIFGGNEINRSQARQFVQGVGGQIARKYECAVVIPAHPSAAGLSSGQGTSGSTAWNNTFRSRLYITRPGDDSDTRLVSRMKSNYAPKGGEITVRWDSGAFTSATPVRDAPEIPWPVIDLIFEEVTRAWNAKEPWSSEPRARPHGRYLPAWIAQTFEVNEKFAARLLQAWLMGRYLRLELIDHHSKLRGLRVLRFIHHG